MNETLKRAAIAVTKAKTLETMIYAIRDMARVLRDDPPKPAPDPGDTPVCARCGSAEVTQDATAAYDPDTGKWIIVDFCDSLDCDACGSIAETVTRRQYGAAHV